MLHVAEMPEAADLEVRFDTIGAPREAHHYGLGFSVPR